MMTLNLAMRNLLRNRRRSLATLLALAIGATSVLLFGGYSADIRYTLMTDYVQTGGHLRIQHKDFYLFGSGNPTAYGIAGYEKLAKAIREDAEIRSEIRVVSPTLLFGGLAGNYEAGVSRPVVGFGYVSEDVARMREWNEFKLGEIWGPYPLLNAPDDAAIVGVGVARVLQLCEKLALKNCPRPSAAAAKPGAKTEALPADIAALAAGEPAAPDEKPAQTAGGQKVGVPIELLATQPRGSPNVASLKVVAAEDQGFKEFDEVTVKLQLAQAQRLVYGKSEPKATSLMIQLEHTDSMERVRARIKAILDQQQPGHDLTVMNFKELNPFYGETIALFNTIFGFIFVLIGGIVLFTVSNTMMAAVMERTTEIGTVRAVGLRQSGIRRLFVTEGFLLGCVGAVIGVLSAVLLATLVNSLRLTWLPPGSSTPLPLSVRVLSEYGMMIGTAIGLIIIATGSAWLPAWRAARLSIVEALRHA
jgi:putative ABC transport system permease protein